MMLISINEHIDFTFPGDLVVDGSKHHHWTDDFFDQGKNILSYIPLYPVLGNHERDHAFYFTILNYPITDSWIRRTLVVQRPLKYSHYWYGL